MTEFEQTERRELDPTTNDADRKTILDVYSRVKTIVRLQGYKLDEVLVRGYGSDLDLGDDEFALGEGKRSYHLGTVEDMVPPELTSDEELKEDKWMANPLKYAIQGGTLGIYLKSKLIHLNHEVDTDDEFGTVVADVSAEELKSALIPGIGSEITILSNPQSVELNEEEYRIIVFGQEHDASLALAREHGISADSGIVKLMVKSGSNKENRYISTATDDFGLGIQHVIEVLSPSTLESRREFLGEQLAATALESAEPMQEGAEQSNSGLGEMSELSARFVDQYEQQINDIATRQYPLDSIFNESMQLLSHFNIQSITKERLVVELIENLTKAKAMIDNDNEVLVEIKPKVLEFSAESDRIAETIVRDEDATQHDKKKIKSIAEAAEEVRSNVSRATEYAADDFSQELDLLFRVVNEFENENWGGETYVAQIKQALDRLSDATHRRMRLLKFTESPLVTLRSIIE